MNNNNSDDKIIKELKSDVESDSNKNKVPTVVNKCSLGNDFIAPDGGWGWFVVIAAGCSNVSYNQFCCDQI